MVAAYFAMLEAELRGDRPIKADVNRNLQAVLPARTRGSIEYKLQNVSAVLDEQHLPFIDGYKPATNFQNDLRLAVTSWVGRNSSVAEELATYGSAPPPPTLPGIRLRDVLVVRPAAGRTRPRDAGLSLSQGDWGAMRDAQLRSLGEAGEQWVVNLEQSELHAVGRSDLADQVEWSSRKRGDGLGYDVSSFESDGSPIQIEVKTTNLGERSPFYVTRNEVATSAELSESFRLYRVFNFAREPRLFVVPGPVALGFRIEPMIFEARV